MTPQRHGSTNGNGSTGGAAGGRDPFAAVRESLGTTQRQFDPHNARRVIEVIDAFPSLLGDIARFANTMGQRAVDAVDIDPRVAPFLIELGSYLAKAEGPTASAMTAVRKAHQDRIDRYENGTQRDAAWDVSQNRE